MTSLALSRLGALAHRRVLSFVPVACLLVACGPAPLGPDVGRAQPVGADTTLPTGSPQEPAPTLPPSASAPAPQSAAPSSDVPPSSGDAPAAAVPGKAARASVGEPKFEGGDVPKAKGALDKLGKAMAKCVSEHGGLHGSKGSLDVQFLVRAQGIAEGVDVLSAVGVDDDAKKCVRDALKKKTMGPPSADPVGVTVKIELEPASSP